MRSSATPAVSGAAVRRWPPYRGGLDIRHPTSDIRHPNTPRLGYVAFVLHAHIPYVIEHGHWPHGMDWLFEAVAESYIPLLEMLHRLVVEGISPRITLGMTPILVEQLQDPDFGPQFSGYLEEKLRRSREAASHFHASGEHEPARLAERWEGYYERIGSSFFDTYGGDIPGALQRLQDAGHIEVLGSAATHGYLPLLGEDDSVQGQVSVGAASHQRHFGRRPRGFWLPECGYRPRYQWAHPVETSTGHLPQVRRGTDEFLADAGIGHFFVDTAMLQGGEALGVYRERFGALELLWQRFAETHSSAAPDQPRDLYRPYLVCSEPGGHALVAVLARDQRTGLQVWSGEHGYPGDGWYLDFHKKYFPGGLRLWRVTRPKGDLAEKLVYEPDQASGRIESHADHFVSLAKNGLEQGAGSRAEPGIACAMFDAELFGHWWFEGIEWLEGVLRRLSGDPDLQPTTVAAYLDNSPAEEVVSLPEGSWGQGGFHWVWLNEWTSWIWREVYRAEEAFYSILAECARAGSPVPRPLILQLARELLLLESSDWPFLITTFNARDYAELRFDGHLQAFSRLMEMARRLLEGNGWRGEDEAEFRKIQQRDRPFADEDIAAWIEARGQG